MFKFFRKRKALLSESAKPKSAVSVGSSGAVDTKRELIPIVLKFVMRQAGVPLGWLTCGEVFSITRSGKKETCVQIVIKHWDERIFGYLLVLQREFRKGLDLFEPGVDHQGFTFSWTVDASIKSPAAELPPSNVWMTPPVVRSPTTQASRQAALNQRIPVSVPMAPAVTPAPKIMPQLSDWDHRSQHFADTDMLGNF